LYIDSLAQTYSLHKNHIQSMIYQGFYLIYKKRRPKWSSQWHAFFCSLQFLVIHTFTEFSTNQSADEAIPQKQESSSWQAMSKP
ncbi:TPA: hypothetical protein ACHVHO_001421, partial [Streptococcus suis]